MIAGGSLNLSKPPEESLTLGRLMPEEPLSQDEDSLHKRKRPPPNDVCSIPPSKKKYSFENPLIDEIKKHTLSCCRILFFSILEYLHICSDIQTKIKLITKSSKFLHPFTNCITQTSFMFDILRHHCLKLEDHYLLWSDFAARLPSSKFEVEYVSYLEYIYGTQNVSSKYSSATPEFKWSKGDSIPDAIVNRKMAYFINGCIIHGHSDLNCPFATEKTKNALLYGITFQDRHVDSTRRISDFKKKYKDKFEVKEVFECTWLQLQNSLGVKKFLEETKLFRPVQRLNPRDIQRGGIVEAFAHKNSNVNRTLHYKDVVSLYGYVSMVNLFPLGFFRNLLGRDINTKDIRFEDGNFYYGKKKMIGFAHVRVLPPRDLEIPFLYHKINDKNMLFNCYTCAKSQIPFCCHESLSERSFCDSYTLPEIAYAKSLKYEILEWFEIYLYPKEEKIFYDFVRILASGKLKASGFPSHCQTQSSKLKFCKEINSKMNLDGELELSPDNVDFSAPRRKFYKDAINNVFGKFSSKQSSTLKCVESQTELEKAFASNIITDLNVIKDKCFIQCLVPQTQEVYANLTTNMPIGAHVSAFGRIEMHKNLVLLRENKAQIFMCNTDGVLYDIEEGQQSPLRDGLSFGDFADVYEGCDLQNAALITPRNFTLLMKDKRGNLKQETKLAGFSQSKEVKELLSPEMYFEFLHSYSIGEEKAIKVPQQRFFRKTGEKSQWFSFKNNLSNKRYIDKLDPILKSYPYGFKA